MSTVTMTGEELLAAHETGRQLNLVSVSNQDIGDDLMEMSPLIVDVRLGSYLPFNGDPLPYIGIRLSGGTCVYCLYASDTATVSEVAP